MHTGLREQPRALQELRQGHARVLSALREHGASPWPVARQGPATAREPAGRAKRVVQQRPPARLQPGPCVAHRPDHQRQVSPSSLQLVMSRMAAALLPWPAHSPSPLPFRALSHPPPGLPRGATRICHGHFRLSRRVALAHPPTHPFFVAGKCRLPRLGIPMPGPCAKSPASVFPHPLPRPHPTPEPRATNNFLRTG